MCSCVTNIACVYFHQKPNNAPTAVSRLDLLHILWTDKQVCIDRLHGNTPDKAMWKSHYYSDKAPGTAALALPGFAVAAIGLEVAAVPLDSPAGWLISSWVACASSLAIITALGAAALFAWLARRVPPRVALLTTVALFLGAAPLPYATMMFSHSLVVGCLAIALWALDREPVPNPNAEARVGTTPARCFWRGNRFNLLAGFACGWALASEYTAGLVIVGMTAIFLWGQRRRLAAFGLAALPPLLLIPAYSWACLGTPFALPYSYQASFPEMKEGLYAIKWPDATTAFNLLFSTERGLFFWSPFLLLAGVGYFKLFEKPSRWLWLCYSLPLLQILVISGRVWDWPAGPTLGPRYLAPMLPLLALPCALGFQRFPRIGTVLAVYSIGITVLATATNACPPFNIGNPLTNLHIPLFIKGEFSYSIGQHVLGLPPLVSFALYVAILAGGIWWLWRKLPATSPTTEPEPSERGTPVSLGRDAGTPEP